MGEPSHRGVFGRALLIGLVLFGLVLATLAAIVWLRGPEQPLPFDYDGF